MGSFGGHILPGTFFLGFGIYWTFSMFSRYFKFLVQKINSNQKIYFECTPTYQSMCCPNLPAEALVKVIASAMGIICEYVTALEDGKFAYIGNAQHITMYIFMLINGLIDILIYFKYPLPKGSDYMSLTLAFGIETLLFCFHLHGRTALDIHVHTLLIIAAIASTIACIIEWKYRYSMLSAYFRTLCVLLQGSWFYQVGFTLYPPFPGHEKVDEDSHRQLMLITCVFCWHIVCVMAFMGFVGFCFYYNSRHILMNRDITNYTDIKYKNLENDVSLEILTPKSKERFNNNKIQNKYSVDESGDEEL